MERLTIYDFHKIMHDINSLHISNFRIDEYASHKEKEEIAYIFNWEWNNYSGYGHIFTIQGNINTDSDYCAFSHLTISTNSKRQAQKHVSELYNENELLELFQYILSIYNL